MGPNYKEGAGDGGIALGEESELFLGGAEGVQPRSRQGGEGWVD